MESNSSNSGGFSATVTFDISADPDLAAVEIQNRIKLAESRLPAEVIQNGISVEKQAASQLLTLCLKTGQFRSDRSRSAECTERPKSGISSRCTGTTTRTRIRRNHSHHYSGTSIYCKPV